MGAKGRIDRNLKYRIPEGGFGRQRRREKSGGEGRNRTDEYSFCRAVPYHLATPPQLVKLLQPEERRDN